MSSQERIELVELVLAELGPQVILVGADSFSCVALLGFVELFDELLLFFELFVDNHFLCLVEKLAVLLNNAVET